MKKVYSNIFVIFSLFLILLCMTSCGSKTVFGTYINENDSKEYYTLNEDYTWESHKSSGTFKYTDGEPKIHFTDENGEKFSFSILEFERLVVEEYSEKHEIYMIEFYEKK